MHAVANVPDATEPTTKPTIILPAGVRPAKACSSDTTRPMLCHAYLREREDGWWLLATDAYIAAAIKVEARGDVVEGYVPFGALSDMRYGGIANEQVSATAWAVLTERGRTVYEVPEPVVSSAKPYPDFDVLGVWEGEPAEPVWDGPGRDASADEMVADSFGTLSYADAWRDVPAVVPDDWSPREGMACWSVCRKDHPRAIKVWMCETVGDDKIPAKP